MLPIDEIRLNFNPASLAVLNGVLAFLMFGIALDTRIEDFKRISRMPMAFAVGVGAQFVALHGFSGGGGMAALLAERRTDVVFLATVAGNLDHKLWTTLHGDTPLTGSLNPVDGAGATRGIPQLHVIGGKDTVVPKAILDSWCKRLPSARITRITEPQAGHSGPWEAVWPGLLRRARIL